MIINRKNFISALTNVLPGTTLKSAIPQVDCFIFENDKVWSFNGETLINQNFESGFTGAVKANDFYKLLCKLKDDELEINLKKNKIDIKGKTISIKMNIDPKINMQPIEENNEWINLPKDFNESVSMCIFSTGNNLSPPAFKCLYIVDDIVYSTDGYRATKKTMLDKIEKSFLLPVENAKILIKYNATKYNITDNGWIYFINEESTTFCCRMVNLEFPKNIQEFFEIDGESIDLPDSIDEAVDRSSSLVTDSFELNRFVTIKIKNNNLSCDGKGISGSMSENIKVDWTGEEIKFLVNPNFFMAIIRNLKSVIVGERLLFKGINFEHVICLVADEE